MTVAGQRRWLWSVSSALIVVWARTRPSYDAYGWLVWGYQTVHGSLDLGGAPSWKPLPFLFTVPYALFGHAQVFLWMTTAVAISLAGAIFAARIAYRLTLAGPHGPRRTRAEISRRTADTAHWSRPRSPPARCSGSRTTRITSSACSPIRSSSRCVIAAVDCHLCGRRRWAFWLLWLGSLGRPEAWLWLGLYGLYAWLRVPAMRWQVVLGAIGQLFFWFGVPTITNGRPFVSAQLAENSPRELHGNIVIGTLGRFTELEYLPVWLAALACTAWAALTRNRLVLALAAGAAGWVVVEVAFALHGWPGLPRYMFEAAALCAVLAGVFVGWALTAASSLHARVPAWAGAPLVVILAVALAPERTGPRCAPSAPTSSTSAGARPTSTCSARSSPSSAGRCTSATAATRRSRSPGSARWPGGCTWTSASSPATPPTPINSTRPHIVFEPSSRGGWVVTPYHLRQHNAAVCSQLHARFEVMPGHPDGLFQRLCR